MNLWIRLVWVLVAAFLSRGRLGLFDPSVRRFRVRLTDLDTNRHMNNGRYLSICDLGRMDLIIRTGMWRTFLKRGWVPVLAGASVRFRRELGPFEPYDLETRVVGWDARWIYLRQRAIKRDGRLSLQAYVKTAFLEKGRGLVPATEIAAAAGVTDPSPPLPEALQAWLRADEAEHRALEAEGAVKTA